MISRLGIALGPPQGLPALFVRAREPHLLPLAQQPRVAVVAGLEAAQLLVATLRDRMRQLRQLGRRRARAREEPGVDLVSTKDTLDSRLKRPENRPITSKFLEPRPA